LLVAIGLIVVVLAQEYRFGSSARMGPGYFPSVLGCLLALLGLTLSVPALMMDGEPLPTMHLRPILMVLLGIAAFGVTLEYLGFVAAIVSVVLISGFADPDLRLVEILGLAFFMVAFSVLVFVTILGLPLRLWPSL
jgi:hypothetical protein